MLRSTLLYVFDVILCSRICKWFTQPKHTFLLKGNVRMYRFWVGLSRFLLSTYVEGGVWCNENKYVNMHVLPLDRM